MVNLSSDFSSKLDDINEVIKQNSEASSDIILGLERTKSSISKHINKLSDVDNSFELLKDDLLNKAKKLKQILVDINTNARVSVITSDISVSIDDLLSQVNNIIEDMEEDKEILSQFDEIIDFDKRRKKLEDEIASSGE